MREVGAVICNRTTPCARNGGGLYPRFSACCAAFSRRDGPLPPTLLPLIIVLAVLPRIVELAAAPAQIAKGGVPVAPAIEADEVVVPGVAARNGAAHRKAALR